MGVRRECAALASFEIHDIVTDGSPPKRQCRLASLSEHCQLIPKLRLAASVPAIARSIGEPRRIKLSVVVMCASTQVCVGISSFALISSSIDNKACARSGLSVAGLIPMTASPAPSIKPSRMLAAVPRSRATGRHQRSVLGHPMPLRSAAPHSTSPCARSAKTSQP